MSLGASLSLGVSAPLALETSPPFGIRSHHVPFGDTTFYDTVEQSRTHLR